MPGSLLRRRSSWRWIGGFKPTHDEVIAPPDWKRCYSGAGLGREMVNVLPSPTWLVTVTDPPCAATIALTMDNPSPVLPRSRLRALSVR